MKAIWNNAVIAESDDTVEVEGDIYFPPDSVKQQLLRRSNRTSYCPWKGTAQYFSIVADGETNPDAAWCYPEPKDLVRDIEGYVAFWHGVELTD